MYLRQALKKMDISSYANYQEKVNEWEDFNNRVFHGGQKKIDALRDLVVRYYDSYQYKRLSGQYISVKPNSCHDKLIDNYMCLFPKRSLIETSTLLTYLDRTPHQGEEYGLPPNDFFKHYFRFEKVIQNHIAFLYPIGTDEETQQFTESKYKCCSIEPLKNVAEVSQDGMFCKIIQKPDVFYLAFPWLYNANTDDYIELCDKYPSEFELLAVTIEKIAQASNGESDLHTDVLLNLKEALCNIQISFDKKKSALKTKGITAIMGLAITCIPFASPYFLHNFNPTLFQAIIGSTTLLGSKDILENFFSLKKEGIENPYWVLWKWKQKTIENNSVRLSQ